MWSHQIEGAKLRTSNAGAQPEGRAGKVYFEIDQRAHQLKSQMCKKKLIFYLISKIKFILFYSKMCEQIN